MTQLGRKDNQRMRELTRRTKKKKRNKKKDAGRRERRGAKEVQKETSSFSCDLLEGSRVMVLVRRVIEKKERSGGRSSRREYLVEIRHIFEELSNVPTPSFYPSSSCLGVVSLVEGRHRVNTFRRQPKEEREKKEEKKNSWQFLPHEGGRTQKKLSYSPWA